MSSLSKSSNNDIAYIIIVSTFSEENLSLNQDKPWERAKVIVLRSSSSSPSIKSDILNLIL